MVLFVGALREKKPKKGGYYVERELIEMMPYIYGMKRSFSLLYINNFFLFSTADCRFVTMPKHFILQRTRRIFNTVTFLRSKTYIQKFNKSASTKMCVRLQSMMEVLPITFFKTIDAHLLVRTCFRLCCIQQPSFLFVFFFFQKQILLT